MDVGSHTEPSACRLWVKGWTAARRPEGWIARTRISFMRFMAMYSLSGSCPLFLRLVVAACPPLSARPVPRMASAPRKQQKKGKRKDEETRLLSLPFPLFSLPDPALQCPALGFSLSQVRYSPRRGKGVSDRLAAPLIREEVDLEPILAPPGVPPLRPPSGDVRHRADADAGDRRSYGTAITCLVRIRTQAGSLGKSLKCPAFGHSHPTFATSNFWCAAPTQCALQLLFDRRSTASLHICICTRCLIP